jgi:cellobiose phosphorylase
MTTYGRFDDAAREYIITNPKTPVKWINYIGTISFGGFVDHTGGMLICAGDPALNRILKYIPQLPASSMKGSTIYMRLRSGIETRLFSPFFVPVLGEYDLYECHVGLGYTRIIMQQFGIRSEVTFFVPIGEHRVIQDVRVTNVTSSVIDLDIIPLVEYTHPDALKQFNNADWVPQTMVSKAVHQDEGHIILLQYPFMHKNSQVNFFTTDQLVTSFETDRQRFLGDNGYGSWSAPNSLAHSSLSNYEALRGDNIAALFHTFFKLQPEESRRLVVQLGQAQSCQAALPGIKEYRQHALVDAALEEIVDDWNSYLDRVQVKTPDLFMNRMLNVHNPRQCLVTKNWSRYLSLYQLGLGARGMGFRDSSQDVMGVLANAPKEAKELIRMLLRIQLSDGSAMHQFNPLTMVANAGDAREEEDGPQFYSDDHLWVVLAVIAYLKETGDFEFLEELVPFYQEEWTTEIQDLASVWEHLERAVSFTANTLGNHGLPLAGFADWNDTVNLPQGAESLFTANLYGFALQELISLAQFQGDSVSLERLSSLYREMKQTVNEKAWDGDWYIRYFDSNGTPIGSRSNDAGQIFTNAQSWSVLSGFAPFDRAVKALDAVYERLNTSKGIKLSTPGYDGYDSAKGGITTYPPGAKENGGIFLHANPWVIMAEATLGRGDRAYEYYNQVNPAAKNDEIDQFECEPYVYPQNILGDEHPQFGLARNSWLTGTASWMYQAGIQYILGVRSDFGGLLIDPCIPSAWEEYSVTRIFRGVRYHIKVENPEHVSNGVSAVYVDGHYYEGNLLPLAGDDQIHQVRVILGCER